MEKYQAKGYILEESVKKILKKQGYDKIPPNIQNYYNVEKGVGGDLKIKGRGAKHQIDALGQFGYPIPFVYPIRLLTEAKCLDDPVGIGVVRNFVGVLKDISENYFIEEFDDLDEKQRGRFTDVAAIFSTSSFSKNAQMYAYAQGIFLVSCSHINDFIKDIYDSLKNENQILTKEIIRNHFKNDFDPERKLNKIYFANLVGSYPILIKSRSSFPISLFRNRDEHPIKLTFQGLDEHLNRIPKLNFKIIFNDWEGEFKIPEYILQKLVGKLNPEEILSFKENYINSIEIPMVIGRVKRIISLKLDLEWINTLKRLYMKNQNLLR